ncbi:mitochondrial sodium/calcium exchanger protein-like isoform X2 [Ruditapes philippinarum]|uniref:mitochondrial sodium/calcium exchanger protein-like isoform X2 n=1 Tax=Ruditapes philippinarum TaxID=129788 RepID=UPI00295C1C8A|nr:mitochondrial sodium/calcium exchanger protein-like isoform X2 [Ruditapes philippinarum]
MKDLKIKHFCKGVIFAVIFAVLWYFHSKASAFGTVLKQTEADLGDSIVFRNNQSDKLQADAYRQTIPSKVRSRGLKWVQEQGHPSYQGKLLYSDSESVGDSSDDPDNDADCSDVHKQNMTYRCTFVNVTDDCQIDEGFLDYTYFVYCDFSSNLLPLGIVILIIWWLFLFVGLAVTADDFFCPALAVISDTLKLSHNVAGVTFLAFGNGAPDIFSAIAAIGNAKDGDAGLALGALLGAGVFVTTVVAGFIAIICPFDSMQRPFLRDMIFYIAAVFWTFCVLWDKKITKIEAIGFILLYVFYVLVVVIGRYIYTRQRSNSTSQTGGIIQEPIVPESTVENTEQSVRDGESQPLLSNPDVISLTAVRDQTPLQEFLHHINPIDTDEWSGFSLFKKIYEVFKAPIMFCLLITVPVVNCDLDKNHWNRHLYTLQCVLGPLFGVAATKVGFSTIGGSFPVWGLTLILAVLLAALVFFTSKNEVQPKYHAAFAYLGFVVAVVWIYSIANEIVNILQTFGVVFNISNAILGLTLLAWGNSIGDFIADTVMAKQGFPRMGISACFGGPLFNLLLGIGIPFTIATIKQGDYKIQITLEEVVLAGFLALSLISSIIIVPLSRFRMSRGWGIYLVVLYVVFLIVAILTETKVIHADIDTTG